MQLSLRVIAQGPEARATDGFVLQLDEAKKPGQNPAIGAPTCFCATQINDEAG